MLDANIAPDLCAIVWQPWISVNAGSCKIFVVVCRIDPDQECIVLLLNLLGHIILMPAICANLYHLICDLLIFEVDPSFGVDAFVSRIVVLRRGGEGRWKRWL